MRHRLLLTAAIVFGFGSPASANWWWGGYSTCYPSYCCHHIVHPIYYPSHCCHHHCCHHHCCYSHCCHHCCHYHCCPCRDTTDPTDGTTDPDFERQPSTDPISRSSKLNNVAQAEPGPLKRLDTTLSASTSPNLRRSRIRASFGVPIVHRTRPTDTLLSEMPIQIAEN